MERDIKTFVRQSIMINKYVYFKKFEYSDISDNLDLIAKEVKEGADIFKFLPVLTRFDGNGDLTFVGYYWNTKVHAVMYIRKKKICHYKICSLMNLPNFDDGFFDNNQHEVWNEKSYFKNNYFNENDKVDDADIEITDEQINGKKIQENISMYLSDLLTKINILKIKQDLFQEN